MMALYGRKILYIWHWTTAKILLRSTSYYTFRFDLSIVTAIQAYYINKDTQKRLDAHFNTRHT
jgi:hypothetical protein